MKKYRSECVLCGGNFSEIFKTNIPVFMGVNIEKVEEKISDCTICKCNNCGEIFIKELIDIKDVYLNNHNIGIVGKTWEEHYNELYHFVNTDIADKTILEISDPSAKIVKKFYNFKSWTIVEPNPYEDVSSMKNVNIIKDFFDENFNHIQNIDVIIHSHFLEHLYNPNSFFKKCNELLTSDGIMIVSIPDMDFFLKNNYSPFNILHFEHTYFINRQVLEFLSNKNGFKIIDEKKYKNHSVFFKLKKMNNVKSKKLKLNIGLSFINNWQNTILKIKNINKLILQSDCKYIYLFGAHVTSQFYLYNGLDASKIVGILDNSNSKLGYNLYGTPYQVFSPIIIEDMNDVGILCSHSGIYEEEIKTGICKINKNVNFF